MHMPMTIGYNIPIGAVTTVTVTNYLDQSPMKNQKVSYRTLGYYNPSKKVLQI